MGLAGGDDDQEAPEVVAVGQVGEAALLDVAAEAVEGAEGDVLLVGGTAGGATQFEARQGHEAAKETVPELLGGGGLAGLEEAQPVRNGTRLAHGRVAFDRMGPGQPGRGVPGVHGVDRSAPALRTAGTSFRRALRRSRRHTGYAGGL